MKRLIKRLRDWVWFARFCVVHRQSLKAQERWQIRHVNRLLARLRQCVPMYRALLAGCEFHREVRVMDDMRYLPVVRSEMFIGHPVEEYINGERLPFLAWRTVRDTDGHPYSILLSKHAVSQRFVDFAELRFMWRGGLRFPTSAARIAYLGTQIGIHPSRLEISQEEFGHDQEAALHKIVQFAPEILVIDSQVLDWIAGAPDMVRSLQKGGYRFVISLGKSASAHTRASIAKGGTFQFFECIATPEVGSFGCQCRLHDGFHIHSESFIVEIVDDYGIPLQDGMEGRVVVTDLFNECMPFVRFDTRYRGRLARQACPCGLQSPRLWIIAGD